MLERWHDTSKNAELGRQADESSSLELSFHRESLVKGEQNGWEWNAEFGGFVNSGFDAVKVVFDGGVCIFFLYLLSLLYQKIMSLST